MPGLRDRVRAPATDWPSPDPWGLGLSGLSMPGLRDVCEPPATYLAQP